MGAVGHLPSPLRGRAGIGRELGRATEAATDMNWEAIGAIVAVVSILLNFGLALTLKRRREEVEVSGHITTRQQAEIVTVDKLTSLLAGYAASEKVHQIREEMETKINDMEDQLGNKIDQRFNAFDTKRSSDIAALHEKVNVANQSIERLKERTETQTAVLDRMDQKLTNLISRREPK
jgi:hypothetical protein